jgi:hypothetical protein
MAENNLDNLEDENRFLDSKQFKELQDLFNHHIMDVMQGIEFSLKMLNSKITTLILTP